MRLLYHYTTAEKAISILESQQFKFGHFENQNDPFENINFRYPINFNDDELRNYVMQLAIFEMEKLSVVCFGTDKDSTRGDKMHTMWAHYANKHQGVCLVFDEDMFINNVKEKYEQPLIQNIDYQRSMTIDLWKIKKYINESPERFLTIFQDNLLFTKHNDWSIENEKRIIVFEYPFEISITKCVHKVVLGPRINENDENELSKIDDNFYNGRKVDKYICLFPTYSGTSKSFFLDNPIVPE
jgi:Protein of unknown function (DUF2971)